MEFQQFDYIHYMMLLSLVQDSFKCDPLFKDHLSCETIFSWQKA